MCSLRSCFFCEMIILGRVFFGVLFGGFFGIEGNILDNFYYCIHRF